ncbi:hypothetical protein BGZ98_000956 [Dissophora globulifera]|nr:hypothetical protein BGZ98_000956 [Dissophora globulifera]
MAAIGGSTLAASQHHNDGYDYQQGYQQVPYGGHTEQYDPYYDQRQHQAQGYYADQQQGYYPEEQQYHNQYAPSTPHNGTASVSLGSSSPSTTLVGASPMSYPQPPPAMSSPRTSTQSAVPVAPGGPSYLNNAKVENNTHSPLRNPQLVPENEERIKVPI